MNLDQDYEEYDLENLGYLNDAVKNGRNAMKEKAKQALIKTEKGITKGVTKVVNGVAEFADRRVVPRAAIAKAKKIAEGPKVEEKRVIPQATLDQAKLLAQILNKPKVAVPAALLI